MTLLFVWACSSGGHEDASVTTSGGAGSEVSTGSAAPSEAEGGSDFGSGGILDGAASSLNEGGTTDDSVPPDRNPPAVGGKREVSSGGAGVEADPPLAIGGTLGAISAGAPGSGAPGAGSPGPSAGATGAGAQPAGGAAAVADPVCDPADDSSTPDMFLPCDVSTALYVCRNCHTNPPVKGVFSSYVTFADIKANAAQIYGVIRSGTMPWPPYTLSPWAKATALKWLGQNGSCAIGAAKSCQ
ncbi:MAG: hypothetical protein WDO69_18145 [Pseudomonadota bacterium]